MPETVFAQRSAVLRPLAMITYRRITAAALVLLVAGAMAGIVVPAGLGWDFANFYDTGRRAAAGQFEDIYDPSSRIAGETPQGAMKFWGTPISAVFYAPLSLFGPRTASTLLKIEGTLACLAGLWLLFRFYRRLAGPATADQAQFMALFSVLCLLYQPFWTVYRTGGQTMPTVFLLLVLAMLTHVAGRHLLTSLLIVLVIAMKPAFIFLTIFLGLTSGISFFMTLAAVSASAALVSIALMGWPLHQEFIELVRTGAGLQKSWVFNSALYVPFVGLRPETVPAPVAAGALAAEVVLKGIVAVTCGWLLYRSRQLSIPPRARRHYTFLLAICGTLLLSQIVWEHYLSMLFLLLAYVWAARQHMSRGAMGLMVAIMLCAAGQNLIMSLYLRELLPDGSVVINVLMGVWKSAPLLLTLVFLWRHSAEWWRSYRSPEWSEATA